MKIYLFQKKQKIQSFLEKRLVFVNKYGEGDVDSEEGQKEQVKDILNNKDRKLNSKDKWLLRKYRNKIGFREKINERLRVDDKKINELVRKYPNGITEDYYKYAPARKDKVTIGCGDSTLRRLHSLMVIRLDHKRK